ncbi:5-hydroxytryptamine receptor 2A-like [Ornithodoros turicata]|uniref:5-hydroxytryptamine receptor 2A-like n=1 Tax=Ornithodoros turicata TaxID=34597 RepID=UPI0031387E97
MEESHALRVSDEDSNPDPDAPVFNWSALALSTVPVAGVLGNSLVVLAVWQQRRLQNVTNFFLVSLAVADLMVCLAVMPFGIIDQFYGYWPFGWVVCTVWTTCDVLGCSASILHLCCISVGRYAGIRNPLQARQSCRSAVLARVAAVWLLAALISCPVPVLAFADVGNVLPSKGACGITNRFFMTLGSLLAFYLPMLVMVTTYVLTVRELKQVPCTLSPNISSGSEQTSSGGRTGQTHCACPAAVALRAARAMNERKATKVLGVVFLLFVVCWAPFFILNVAQAFVGPRLFPSSLATTFLWLGYVSSTVNPLVYTAFNRAFRSAFWQLLTCHCGPRPPKRRKRHLSHGGSQSTHRDMVSWSFKSSLANNSTLRSVQSPC